MVNIPRFLIWAVSRRATGSPRTPQRRVGLHILQRVARPPPGPCGHPASPSPGPRPQGDYFKLLFLTIFFYLLASNTCLLVDPHATTLATPPPSSLGVGGFPRAAPSAADPEKKKTSRSNSNFAKVRLKIA